MPAILAAICVENAIACINVHIVHQCLFGDRFKLLKWWAQSFLIGITKIVCGFRDDAGIVRQIQEFHTMELPKQCRVCIAFFVDRFCDKNL